MSDERHPNCVRSVNEHSWKRCQGCFEKPCLLPTQPDLYADVALVRTFVHRTAVHSVNGYLMPRDDRAPLDDALDRIEVTIARLERIEKVARAFGPHTSPEWVTVTFLREDVERLRVALTRKEVEHE